MKSKTILINITLFVLCSPHSFSQEATYEFNWLKYYEAAEGKAVGIWPHWNRWLEIERVKDLHYYKGFNYIFAYPDTNPPVYNNILAAGYEPSKIMVKIDYEGKYTYPATANFPQSWAYYVDEPADRNFPYTWLSEVKNFINTNFPGSRFAISGYKRNSQLVNYGGLADDVMFSSYKHWWTILGIWVSCCPEDPDQRPDWSDMKNIFGNKFSMTWIGAHKDLNEYPQLLAYAKNLGLQSVWLYQHDEVWDDDNNIEQFLHNAALNGFMKVFYRQVRDKIQNGQLISRQFLGQVYPDAIPSNYNHTTLTFNQNIEINNNRVDDYYALNSITAGGTYTFIVPPQKQASFNSHGSIRLRPGFHAKSGSKFNAYIGDR